MADPRKAPKNPKEIRADMRRWLDACPEANRSAVMLDAQSPNFRRQLDIYSRRQLGAQYLAIYNLDSATKQLVDAAAPQVDELLLIPQTEM